MPWSAGAWTNRTVPELSIFEPSIERHEIRSPGTSSVISASHSAVIPIGPCAFQCERFGAVERTSSRWAMKSGKLSKLRQCA